MIDPEAYRLREEKWTKQNQRLMAGFVAVAVAVLIIGLTLTWFVGNQSASTAAQVRGPSKLRILGPNSTAIEQLDLSYDASNVDGDQKVTVTRGFCVESEGEPFELQVANTTNIGGLAIKVYRVTVNDKDAAGDVVEKGEYSWSKGDEVSFQMINDADNDGVANDPTGNNDETFGNYTDVQANAAPLYRWTTFSYGQLDQEDGAPANATNFIIEATWTESAKETDMVYLIARNTSTSNSN